MLLRGIDMSYTIYGTDWCNTCRVVKRHLTSLDVPFEFVTLPPGEQGWSIVEQLTGSRGLPAIIKDGTPLDFDAFKKEIDAMGITPRPLTQDELDELDE